jgi:uncharacterized BrkB/YihY/UPF0761 family membrane protein
VYPASKEARTGAFWAKAAVVSVAINSAILNSVFIALLFLLFFSFCQVFVWVSQKTPNRKIVPGIFLLLFLFLLFKEIKEIKKWGVCVCFFIM